MKNVPVMEHKIFPCIYMDIVDYFMGMDRNLPNIHNKEVRLLHDEAVQQLNADFAFTSFTEGNRDYSINMERAAQIVNDLPSGNFRLEVTTIRIDKSYAIEETFDVYNYARDCVFVFNKNTPPQFLVGLDCMILSAIPMVVIYAGFKLG